VWLTERERQAPGHLVSKGRGRHRRSAMPRSCFWPTPTGRSGPARGSPRPSVWIHSPCASGWSSRAWTPHGPASALRNRADTLHRRDSPAHRPSARRMQ